MFWNIGEMKYYNPYADVHELSLCWERYDHKIGQWRVMEKGVWSNSNLS